jgi:hypothetical protein
MTDDPMQILQQQLGLIADDCALLSGCSTLAGASFLLGCVRGRLNCLCDLGLLSHEEAHERAGTVRAVFDQHFPALTDAKEP